MKVNSLRKGKAGFTLVELVIVIIVLGILAAVAVPKFMDFSSDAKDAAFKGSLNNVRSAISNFYAYSATPSGGGTAKYPTLKELTKEGTVLSSYMPDNPYSTSAVKNAVKAGKTKGKPVTSGTKGGWCYLESSGQIWADTKSGSGEADL